MEFENSIIAMSNHNETEKSIEIKTQDEPSEPLEGNVDPIHDIIDYLTRQNNIYFKSQQLGESELSTKDKSQIAHDLYKKSKVLFLTKFGKYLTLDHLAYFESLSVGQYELICIIAQLKTLLDDKNRKTVVKNRRFEALSKMVKDDLYFSETEMMQRNPLLYEQLVGQYLTENERVARDNIDTQNITLLDVLIKGMDKKYTKEMLEKQKCDEDCQMEENSSDNDEEELEDEEEISKNFRWGEFTHQDKKPSKKMETKTVFATAAEKLLFREEFVQEMYRSFLAGEDETIDYSTIDDNTDYDCLDVKGLDEEEKYFDSETPEDVGEHISDSLPKDKEDVAVETSIRAESEDELDVYMRHLNEHPTLQHLSQT